MGILLMDNQNMEVSAQLDSGVRFLQAQTHLDGLGRFSLCHTDCGMKDSGSIQDFLATIINWLDTHPIEVVTLLLTNGDHVSLDYFEKAFSSSSASHHAYIPIPRHNASIFSSWPTPGSLISVPYILNEFTYFWETLFDTTDPSFPQCTISRPGELHAYPAIAYERMIIMNHFLNTDVLAGYGLA